MLDTVELTTQELKIQKAVAASDMYKLLALMLSLPTEEIAAGIFDGSLAKDVKAIFGELGFVDRRVGAISDRLGTLQEGISGEKELFTGLRQEYTRLFSHPVRPAIQIYETLFLYKPEGRDAERPPLFVSPAAMDAGRCYRQAGLVRSKTANEPEDHMATEMEFMAYLYFHLAKALNENDQEGLAHREGQIREFSQGHLQKWAVDFFESCISASENSVYQTVGLVGSTFIDNMLQG